VTATSWSWTVGEPRAERGCFYFAHIRRNHYFYAQNSIAVLLYFAVYLKAFFRVVFLAEKFKKPIAAQAQVRFARRLCQLNGGKADMAYCSAHVRF